MTTTQTIFVKFDFPPTKSVTVGRSNYVPKPLHHPTKKNIIIVSTDSTHGNDIEGIYEWDLVNNTMNQIYTYPQGFYSRNHGQLIDTQTNSLYIFGNNAFGIFNLDSKIMELNKRNELHSCNCLPRTTYIPSPINEWHILDHATHWKMNMKTKTVTKISNNAFKTVYRKLMYVPYTKQLISMGGDVSDEIWYCNIKQNQDIYNWQLHSLKMPHTIEDELECDVLLAFDNIIFVFYFEEYGYTNIWCLDLLYNEWIKTQYNVPRFELNLSNVYVMKSDDGYGHIISFDGEYYKFVLHDLIPKKVIKTHRKYYEPLVMGYMKKQENENSVPSIAYVLKQLILLYYPLFC